MGPPSPRFTKGSVTQVMETLNVASLGEELELMWEVKRSCLGLVKVLEVKVLLSLVSSWTS